MKPTLLIAFLVLYLSTAFAQFSTYAYKRKLNKVKKEDYYSIELQPEIIASCKSNLHDIRLYDVKINDTSEIPYFLEWMGSKNEQVLIPFQLINNTFNEKCCSYITLKLNTKQPVNQIALNVADVNFDKSVKIEGSNDNKQWFTIQEHVRIVRFNNENEHFEHTILNFQDAEYNYFRLKFDDDGSRKISVTAAYAYENKVAPGNYNELKIGAWKQTENKKEKSSEIIIDMPFQYMVNHIILKGSSKTDFYRNINVYGSNGIYHTPKGTMENWYVINTSVFSSEDSCSIECNNEAVKKLKIEIINYDNQPVTVTVIKAYAEQSHLVANLPVSDNVYVTYGKMDDKPPGYDIEHFKGKIPKELNTIGYGAEQVKVAEVPVDHNIVKSKKWLWIVMIVVILIIGYFALSMLKKENK